MDLFDSITKPTLNPLTRLVLNLGWVTASLTGVTGIGIGIGILQE